MTSIDEAKKLIGYCGAYCGECGLYRGRIVSELAADFEELIEAARLPEWVPQFGGIDFDFTEFQKGLAYFTKKDSGCYCKEPCKAGGGAPCENAPCARERGIQICYECEDFPCEHFSWILENHPDTLEDYQRFEALGLEGWIRFHKERGDKGYLRGTRKYYVRPKTQ